MTSELEISDEEIRRVAILLGAPGFCPGKARPKDKSRGQQLPRKVLVQRIEGDCGRGPIFFFFNEREDGRKEQLLNTRHVGMARREAQAFFALGVPMAVYREWGV